MKSIYEMLPLNWSWKLYRMRLRWRYFTGTYTVDDAWSIHLQMQTVLDKHNTYPQR